MAAMSAAEIDKEALKLKGQKVGTGPAKAAFFCFSTDKRAEWQKEVEAANKEGKAVPPEPKLNEVWATMSDAEKEPYKAMNRDDAAAKKEKRTKYEEAVKAASPAVQALLKVLFLNDEAVKVFKKRKAAVVAAQKQGYTGQCPAKLRKLMEGGNDDKKMRKKAVQALEKNLKTQLELADKKAALDASAAKLGTMEATLASLKKKLVRDQRTVAQKKEELKKAERAETRTRANIERYTGFVKKAQPAYDAAKQAHETASKAAQAALQEYKGAQEAAYGIAPAAAEQ